MSEERYKKAYDKFNKARLDMAQAKTDLERAIYWMGERSKIYLSAHQDWIQEIASNPKPKKKRR